MLTNNQIPVTTLESAKFNANWIKNFSYYIYLIQKAWKKVKIVQNIFAEFAEPEKTHDFFRDETYVGISALVVNGSKILYNHEIKRNKKIIEYLMFKMTFYTFHKRDTSEQK
jgi:hypothetical protein